MLFVTLIEQTHTYAILKKKSKFILEKTADKKTEPNHLMAHI